MNCKVPAAAAAACGSTRWSSSAAGLDRKQIPTTRTALPVETWVCFAALIVSVEKKTIIKQASLAREEKWGSEGRGRKNNNETKPRSVDKDLFVCLCWVLASLHYLSSKKKVTFSPCHESFHLLFVIPSLGKKKTFYTWAFTLTGWGQESLFRLGLKETCSDRVPDK